MTCWQTVVLPDDSGPKISVIRPRGMPPTPSARSSAIEPGRDGVDTSCLARPELHDRAAPELLLDRGQARRRPPCPARPVPAPPLRSSVIAICPSRSSSDPMDRSPERTRWRPPVDQPSSCVVLDDVSFLARLADHLDVLRRLRQRRQARLARSSPSASSWLPCWGRSREPIAAPPRRRAAYRSILHADFSATSPPLTRPARTRSSGIDAGKVPARIAARILAMKSRVKVRL